MLETHLEEILPILGDNFYISDIYEIFYSAFTVLGLRAFEKGEDLDQLESDHKVLGSEEALILEETVRQLDGALTDEHRLVFALWMTDMTQDGRAKELGVSKPTLLSRQKDARAAAAPILRDVPPHIGELALREIISRCF